MPNVTKSNSIRWIPLTIWSTRSEQKASESHDDEERGRHWRTNCHAGCEGSIHTITGVYSILVLGPMSAASLRDFRPHSWNLWIFHNKLLLISKTRHVFCLVSNRSASQSWRNGISGEKTPMQRDISRLCQNKCGVFMEIRFETSEPPKPQHAAVTRFVKILAISCVGHEKCGTYSVAQVWQVKRSE